ncbi:hypothetical protein ES703_04451 [subsurface metagenome]
MISLAGRGNESDERATLSKEDMVKIKEKEKSPGLAAFLSFLICGVGQIYIGQDDRGVGLLILAFILVIFGVGFPLFWLFAFFLWVYAISDAYNQAKKYNVRLYKAARKTYVPPKAPPRTLTSGQIERMVYGYVLDHGGEIDVEECAEVLEISEDEVEKAIRALEKKGKLERE